MTARRISILLVGWVVACGKSAVEPIPGKITFVQITPVSDTLFSLNQTVQLTATAYDGTGTAVAGTSFTWSSDNAAVASVDDQGLVMAHKNGVAHVQVSVGDVPPASAVMLVSQRAGNLEVASGDYQGGTVGMPLDSSIVVSATDALGSPAAGVTVHFDPSGGGSAEPSQAVTDSSGQVTTHWTLGVAAGTQGLEAAAGGNSSVSVGATATAFADQPDTMYLESGNDQTELPSLPLPHPIRVKVVDRYGNGVPGAPINFSVSGGSLDNGLDTMQAPTELDGIASVHWTLGSALGGETGQGVLPDSSVGDNVGLPGSPVSFSATAVAFAFDGVAPTLPVVGKSMTLSGKGFDPNLSGNTVMVDGVAATVTGGSQTTLTVTVPSFGCTPARARTISVTRGSQTSSVGAVVNPVNALALPVGGTAVLSDPADYCLQFLSAGNSAEEYLVGLTATRRLAGELAFALVGDDGITPPPAPPARAASPDAISFSPTSTQREMTLRAWEEDFFAHHQVRPAVRLVAASRAAAAAPAVGQTIGLRVPNIATDACNDYTPVTATILAEGPRAIVTTDATLPADSASVATMTAAIQSFMAAFGNVIYQVATTYFGLPTDLDQNGRITLLFSNTVAQIGMKSLTSAVDLIDPAICPASNGGEVVYVGIPAVPSAQDVAALLQAAPPDMAHDLTHLIQLGRRVMADGVPMAAWLGEGQAELGTELVGMVLRGDIARRDYGFDVVTADQNTLAFYRPRFDRLSYLFGWDGAAGTVAGAPERCSLFGFGGVSVPCAPSYVPGASWSFIRYLSDRLGGAYQGGDPAFQQALIGLDPAHDGTALLEALAGEDLGRLIVDWAMTLYVDGRVPAANARALQMSSWNLANVFGALPAVQRLTPAGVGFASFARSGSLVGGGTAYTLLEAGGPHGALSVHAGDASGGQLGSDLKPRLWVVRVK